jgi:quinol monooxygenase YgiN
MVKLGLYVQLHAKAGKEQELEKFLQSARSLAQAETQTVAWFALKMGPASFGIFDVFEDEAGREAHLQGAIAKQLAEKAAELLARPPEIMKNEIIAAKMAATVGHKSAA